MPAFFRSALGEFANVGKSASLHLLTTGLAAAGFDLTPEQHVAWTEEWPCLETAFIDLLRLNPKARDWTVLLEYPIPGRRKRIDAVLLTDKGVIAIEFKNSESATDAARWQVREDRWNLRDFHRESRGAEIAPIVCVMKFESELREFPPTFSDRHQLVLDVEVCGPASLADSIYKSYKCFRKVWPYDAAAWDNSLIEPTLSVIEFAQQLFSGHDVREISHAHSDNTDVAVERLRAAVIEAKEEQKHVICFVTGVPGAGKTLVGLNAAYRKEMVSAAGGPVCFASGNEPLLKVLKSALVQNRSRRASDKREIGHDIGAPIQNVHDIARDILIREDEQAPQFHVVVFDEAQRVWDAKKLRDGLDKRKRRGQLSSAQIERILANGNSEPDLLLGVMERCEWCLIIALIGGGQEIYDGEAGLAEWGNALGQRKRKWVAWASNEALNGGTGSARQKLFATRPPSSVSFVEQNELHLAVSKRSCRAERYAEWVNSVVIGDASTAKKISPELAEFPVLVTRDIHQARRLLNQHCPPELRCGLLASSGALRLRSYGVEVSMEFRKGINFADWFLRPAGDIRSSSQLEVAATEFECQGLELDWCGICWGGDFVMIPPGNDWCFRKLRAPAGKTPRWYPEPSPDTCEFIRNKYRVLLTRARIGVVIFVPQGDGSDRTREQNIFDCTTEFLLRCGALVV